MREETDRQVQDLGKLGSHAVERKLRRLAAEACSKLPRDVGYALLQIDMEANRGPFIEDSLMTSSSPLPCQLGEVHEERRRACC